jgi:rhodanese-related sulfurtransferase
MNKFFSILLFSFFLIGLPLVQGQTVRTLQAKAYASTLQEVTDTVQLLDVRTPGEYTKGHLKGAKNTNFYNPDFASSVAALDKNKPVFVYCRSGARSAGAARKLKELGFQEIIDLHHGILAWKRAGFEVER